MAPTAPIFRKMRLRTEDPAPLVMVMFPSLTYLSRTQRRPTEVGQSGTIWGRGSN